MMGVPTHVLFHAIREGKKCYYLQSCKKTFSNLLQPIYSKELTICQSAPYCWSHSSHNCTPEKLVLN